MVPGFRFAFVAGFLAAAPLMAQQSPAAQTSVAIAGKTIRIDYSAPSMRGRKIFGGLEPYGRVWRAPTRIWTSADSLFPKAITRYSSIWIRSNGSW